MDFSVPEATKERCLQVRNFINERVIPLEPLLFQGRFDELYGALGSLRTTVKEMALFSPTLPASVGGAELSFMDFAHMSEELGRSPLGHYCFNCQAPDAGNMEILVEYGTEDQKQKWLDPLAKGDIRSCFAMTEPDFPGSNPTWMGTEAVRDGDEYVINGRKWFTSSADGASFTIVMAVTNPDAARSHQRASQIIVPIGTPGLVRVRNIPVMGEAGRGYYSHSEMGFQNCRVPLTNLLGKEGAGFKIAQQRLGPGRIHHCMRWIGICERAMELMVHRAATRELSPGKVLGRKQAIQHEIAESRVEIEAARLMVLRTAWLIDNKGGSACRQEISMIKFYVANILQRVLDRAIQVHGAMGLTSETPLAFWFGHERGSRIYDGADEVHRTQVARFELEKAGMKWVRD